MRDIMLILHFIGLGMGLGTSFGHAFLGIATKKMSAEEATKFRIHSLALSYMGHAGITLLIISGFYLITPYWKTLPSSPLLILKLSLVAVLILLIVLIGLSAKKARQGDAEAHLKRMAQFGKMTLLISVAIVIIAVKFFH